MNDLLVVALFVITAALLLYWFWPGKAKCKTCASELDDFCYCTNDACTYSVRQQT